MELKEDTVARLLAVIAAEKGDEVAEQVLIVVIRMDDGPAKHDLIYAVADGLGVDLA